MTAASNGAAKRSEEQEAKTDPAHVPEHTDEQEPPDQPQIEEPGERLPGIFISHRHADHGIADILRQFILQATAGRVKVFQSSFAGAAPEVGKILSKQLGEELYQAELVFLIYTVPDENWSYCMWECGVAFNPRKEDTKIVVLQCGKHVPAPLGDRIRVLLNDPTSVKTFVKQFLTAKNFFPQSKSPITGFGSDSADVETWSDKLFEQLASIVKYEPDEAWHVWPHLLFELPLEAAVEVKEAYDEGNEKAAHALLREHCVVSESGENAPQLFGRPGLQASHPLSDLIKSWERRNQGDQSVWVRSLLNQLAAGASWEYPSPEWATFKHVQNQNLHVPILLNVRKSPSKRHIQFSIYFPWFKVDEEGAVQVHVAAGK
jgi:hypothetical protein